MEPWLDNLSEDWDSEPRSSPSSFRNVTPSQSGKIRTPDRSISRIPRYSGKGATGSVTSSRVHIKNTAPHVSGQRKALSERDHSSINIPPQPLPAAGSVHKPVPAPTQNSTISSARSVLIHADNATRRTSSSAKNNHPKTTPEWKKLAMRNMGASKQQDLFTATGLESIFHRPALVPDQAPPERPKFSFMQDLETMPSSPPPWSASRWKGDATSRPLSAAESSVVLHVAGKSDELVTCDQDMAPPADISHPRAISSNNEDSGTTGLHEPIKTHEPSQREEHVLKSQVQHSFDGPAFLPTEAFRELDSELSLPSDASQTSHTIPASLAASSTTHGFSPVFISKRNTVDGRVDYAAFDLSLPDATKQLAQLNQERKMSRDQASIQGAPQEHPGQGEDHESYHPPQDARISQFVNYDRGGYSEDDSFRRRPLSPSMSSSALPSDSVAPSDSVSQIHDASVNLAHFPLPGPESRSNQAQDSRLIENPLNETATVENKKVVPSLTHAPIDSDRDIDGPSWVSYPEAQSDGAPAASEAQFAECASQQVDMNVEPAEEENGSEIETLQCISERNDQTGDPPLKEDNPLSRDTRENPTLFDQSLSGQQRTAAEDATAAQILQSAKTQQQLRAVIGRKRKDARYDKNTQTPDLSSIANREILRPRNPTPGQGLGRVSRAVSIDQQTHVAHDIDPSPHQLEVDSGDRDKHEAEYAAKARRLASEVATFRIQGPTPLSDSHRKPSVSTQDYVDEAMKIMELIRARKRAASVGRLSEIDEPYAEPDFDLTPQSVSRPPSREGQTNAWRDRRHLQLDSRVLDHLKKYEETGDDSFLVSSIVRSVKNKEDGDAQLYPEQDESQTADQANRGLSRRYSDPSLRQSDANIVQGPGNTYTSNAATDSSNRTVKSEYSQRAANLARIAPTSVSHLISDEEGRMRFDTRRQTWVRCKGARSPFRDNHPLSSSTVTDEDPLGEIPDLSVNEEEEQVQSRQASTKSQSDRVVHPLAQVPLVDRISSQLTPNAVTNQRDNTTGRFQAALGAQCASLQPDLTASRETGSETLEWEYQDVHSEIVDHSLATDEITDSSILGDVDDSVFGGQRPVAKTPSRIVKSKRRDQSVLFSSPPVTHEWAASHRDDHGGDLSDYGSEQSLVDDIDESHNEENFDNSEVVLRQGTPRRGGRRPPVGLRHNSREASTLSRIDEHREISFVQTRSDGRTMSMSFSISTPLETRRSATTPASLSHILRHSSLIAPLSPLSEFTIHQDDARHLDLQALSKPLVRVVHDTGGISSRSAQALSNLVNKLTDAEPAEPYWETLRSLNLKGNQLDSLHSLLDFCPKLEGLDVSNNTLQFLDGIPDSIRQLNVSANRLTSLTDLSRFASLQYLQVSENTMTDLDTFRSLFHLRELIAEDNHVANLDGVLGLDGLLALKLKGNRIRKVDFQGAGLRRLERLDLSNNDLEHLNGLGWLRSLQELDIRNNELASFETESGGTISSHTVRWLDLSHNRLRHLDLSNVPCLRTLVADANNLESIKGVKSHQHLETICLRGQLLSGNRHLSNLDDFSEVTNLYLSGSRLAPLLSISRPFFCLKTLDVSFTGLQALPSDFGTFVPNLQVLNLNANRIKDLRPLECIPGLRKLYASGNQLGRLRCLARTLGRLGALAGGRLEVLDLRDNPLSLGFYAAEGGSITSWTGMKKDGGMSLVRMRNNDTEGQDMTDEEKGDYEHEGVAGLRNLLPDLDEEKDAIHLRRLDEETAMRRRVYEMLLAARCRRIKVLDGHEFHRKLVARRDEIWDRLLQLGVVVESSGTATAGDSGQ